ncbi:cation:proton antiporter subunit C [Geoalkalibacter halelectricus]|uniref:Cation:proton antiporter subunit C n=1 Tax=Geoalkalibacter halelectricus TaxID=2847045 RepID=A0ABY5ZKU8_9BACT|nr:cation:proton antiporter subunit C [Geoalkalibacter halelectricus]MDO3378311.1 cation:proton antiporter subunit C [Geoalkalibacter halelectricus]UWZ79316.1 cation:proton antiporter subunit C [Geoalkalibacter halelectricus]
MEGLLEEIVAKYNYWIYVVLMMIGFYAMIAKRNLVKKLIGMNIFQTAIILFFVSTGVKRDAGLPIVDKDLALAGAIDVATVVNPLPHVLMLTAIVVGVSVTGIALAVIMRVYREYGTLEEDEILEKIGR